MASGFDKEYIKKIGGVFHGNTIILPGKTITGKKKCCTYGGYRVESMTLGMTKHRFTKNAKPQPFQGNKKFPLFYQKLKILAQDNFPWFKYNTITVNHNVRGIPHKDSKNVGSSIIVGWGDYRGGDLNIEGNKYDIKHRGLMFDGSKHTHWVEEFSGDRWTAVYFWKDI